MRFLRYMARRKTEGIELNKVEISWLGIKGEWVADRKQQTAAWEMYVELITRISIESMGPEEGLLREALTSLHSFFPETRRILKEHGPSVARRILNSEVTFATLAVKILNSVLRPFLAKWHPLLHAYEVLRPATVAPSEFERSWQHHNELRRELEVVRSILLQYAAVLAQAAGIDEALHGATLSWNDNLPKV